MSRTFVVSFAAAAVASSMPVAADAQRVEQKVAGIAFGTLAANKIAEVRLFDTSGRFHLALSPFEAAGGVNVAAGDVNGDGVAELVAGKASGPHVRVFDGKGFKQHLALDPFGAQFTGGISVAAGDVNGDGRADIITGAGPGGGPHVRVFDGNGRITHDFTPFESSYKGGVRVAVGDLNGDGVADIIVGAGPGGGPHVKVFDGASGDSLGSFTPYGEDYEGGINLVAGKFLGQDALFASKIAAGDGSVRVISLSRGGGTQDFKPFGEDYKGSLSVGFTSDGRQDTLVVGQAEGGAVGLFDVSSRAIDGISFAAADAEDSPFGGFYFNPFGADYEGGISVAGLGLVSPLAVPEPDSWALLISGFALAGIGLRHRLRRGERSISAA